MFVDVAFYAAVTPLLPHYEDEFGLSKTGAGILAGSYAAGTLAMSLPSGWLASRLGTKRTAITGLVLMTVTSFAFAFANSIVLLDVARFVQGIGGACAWAGAMAWLARGRPDHLAAQLGRQPVEVPSEEPPELHIRGLTGRRMLRRPGVFMTVDEEHARATRP